jgi:hypothetical protein
VLGLDKFNAKRICKRLKLYVQQRYETSLKFQRKQMRDAASLVNILLRQNTHSCNFHAASSDVDVR